jgi:hypothetical protein
MRIQTHGSSRRRSFMRYSLGVSSEAGYCSCAGKENGQDLHGSDKGNHRAR